MYIQLQSVKFKKLKIFGDLFLRLTNTQWYMMYLQYLSIHFQLAVLYYRIRYCAGAARMNNDKMHLPAALREEKNPIFGSLFSRYPIPYVELGRNCRHIYGISYYNILYTIYSYTIICIIYKIVSWFSANPARLWRIWSPYIYTYPIRGFAYVWSRQRGPTSNESVYASKDSHAHTHNKYFIIIIIIIIIIITLYK